MNELKGIGDVLPQGKSGFDVSFAKGSSPREHLGLSKKEWNAMPEDKRQEAVNSEKK